MRINKLPASSGWAWITTGFALFLRQPLYIVAFTLMYLFMATILAFLPIVGGFSPPFLTPLLTVGLMAAMRAVQAGTPPKIGLMVSPFSMGKKIIQGLLILGLFNCLAYVATLGIASLVDGGVLLKVLTGRLDPKSEEFKTSAFPEAALVFTLLYVPFQMAQWYAPLYVAWHKTGPVQAMFYSFVSVWRNKGAFLVYCSCWLLVAVIAAVVLRLSSGLSGPVGMALVYPVGLGILGAVFASMWATYRDIVTPDEGETPALSD
jgi:hypothetical protein